MLNSTIDYLDNMIGQKGSTLFDDTTARTSASLSTSFWFALRILETATITTLTDAGRDGTALSTGISFSAGTVLYGKFTEIKLASGSAIAYKVD